MMQGAGKMQKEGKMDMKRFWRDPLRAVMETQLSAKGAAALYAVLLAAFGLLCGRLCGGMEGVAVIAACAVLCAAMLLAFAWHALRREQAPVIALLCVAGLAMLTVGAHLALLTVKPGRYTKVLQPMLADMWNYELVSAMAWEEGSWSGVYLILMGLLSRVEHFSWLYAVKLFDMLCQCAAAGAVMKLAMQRGARGYAAVAAMLCCVLAPTMLFNAGLWAQCDATFAMFTLWGLVLLLDGHPLAGCVLWGLALGTKLQSAFLFPLLIVLFMNNRVQLRHLLALAAAAFLCQIAIVLDGQGIESLVTRYAMQLEAVRWDLGLSDNMPNVYKLMNVASVREFSGMGLWLGVGCALLVAAALLRSRSPLTEDTLLLASLLLACGLPLILPQMNARSWYLAGMLAFACAGNVRRMAAAGLMELISLCAYMASIFGHEAIPMLPLALMAIVTAALVLMELLEALGRKQEALNG